MATGPGKYNEQATFVRETTNARAVIVMVLDGNHGHGFSVQAQDDIPPGQLAQILEFTAAEIRKSSH
jgi:hypothetical protein